MPKGSLKAFEVNNKRIAVANVDGAFFAFDDTCTHEEASLSEGEVLKGCVECPLHGARFDLRTGEVKALPAVKKLGVYQVTVETGVIYIWM